MEWRSVHAEYPVAQTLPHQPICWLRQARKGGNRTAGIWIWILRDNIDFRKKIKPRGLIISNKVHLVAIVSQGFT